MLKSKKNLFLNIVSLIFIIKLWVEHIPLDQIVELIDQLQSDIQGEII